MIGMTRLGPGSAQVTEDGREIGRAEWTMETLAWPGEAVKVARVTALQIREDRRADFWAYLCYLFQKDAAAAAQTEDGLTWFSQALRQSWEAHRGQAG